MKAIETSEPEKALREYKEIILGLELESPYAYYQSKLAAKIGEISRNPTAEFIVTKEEDLGDPTYYWLAYSLALQAHHGLARVYLSQGNLNDAIEEAKRSIAIAKDFPPFLTASGVFYMVKSNRLMEAIFAQQGKVGKALITKLSADFLEVYLQNDSFKEESGKALSEWLNGDAAISDFFLNAQIHRIRSKNAELKAALGAVVVVGSGLQQMQAASSLAKSGGVITPEVQMAQMNAQLAQFQVQMLTAIVKMDSGQSKGLDLQASPWAVPTFIQQLVDPKMGRSAKSLVSNFAKDAASVGGTSIFTQGAQQVIRDVDALPTMQTTSNPQAIVKSVESFAGVFNAFLSQVQEIKAAK